MNILFYCNEYPPEVCGGIGVFTKEIAEELTKKGNKVIVYGQYDSVGERSIQSINGVTVIKEPRTRNKYMFFYNRFKAYLSIRKIVAEFSIDIVEVQDFHGLLGFLPKLNAKVVVRLHGSVSYFKSLLNNRSTKDFIWKLLEGSNLMKADEIVSVSDFTAVKTKSIFGITSNVKTIHNGVVVEREYLTTELSSRKQFVYSGSIIEKKGVKELIDAWVVFSKGKDVELNLYGKDIEGLTAILESTVAENNITNVFFHGPVSKERLMSEIELTHFCIFPTKAEAFSLAPIESMSKSKVTLYTNQTSASELIIDGYNGLLIPSCTKECIFQALERAYYLEQFEYTEIAKRAHQSVLEKFDVAKVCNDNIEFYKGLM
ncbi:glycosyltransferase family 4 protein [Vibrio astriarenae]